MKLRRIELDDNELPSRATFDVTADEALTWRCCSER